MKSKLKLTILSAVLVATPSIYAATASTVMTVGATVVSSATIEISDLELVEIIYDNCPDVDHIEALAASGELHQDDLQYLQANENCEKGNDQTEEPVYRTFYY